MLYLTIFLHSNNRIARDLFIIKHFFLLFLLETSELTLHATSRDSCLFSLITYELQITIKIKYSINVKMSTSSENNY